MCACPSAYLCSYPSIRHPSIHPSGHLSIHLDVCAYPSVARVLVRVDVCVLVRLSTRMHVCVDMCLSR